MLERCNPVVDWLETFGIHSIHSLTANPPLAHQPDLLQHPEMLRHHRLVPAKLFDELIDREFSHAEGLQNLSSLGFGHGIERIMGCRCTCHDHYYIPI